MQKGGPIYRQQFLELIRISLKRQDIKYSCIPLVIYIVHYSIMILHSCIYMYISECEADYIPVILRHPKYIPPVQKDSSIALRTRSAKSSLSLSKPSKAKHNDTAN